MINPIVYIILKLIQLYGYVLWAWIILSALIAFNIVNRYQPVVQNINHFLFKMTDPLLRPIRRHMPNMNGVDLSPLVLIVLFNFIEYTLVWMSAH